MLGTTMQIIVRVVTCMNAKMWLMVLMHVRISCR